MKNDTLIVCPQCHAKFSHIDDTHWKCGKCGYTAQVINKIPVFSDYPANLQPSEKIERCAEQGSIWRRFNWKFLEQRAALLNPEAEVLDIGAGRGDFKTIFARSRYTGLDIYPYPELDLAVDLIKVCPFNEESFDLIVMANVIEHVYDYRTLVGRAAKLLKPGGKLLITVPFLLKLHQEPVDFHRYTRYALEQLARENGLAVEVLDGYYNPLAILDEGIGNAWEYCLPQTSGFVKLLTKICIFGSQKLSNYLKKFLGNGYTAPAEKEANPNVLGYQCIFIKDFSRNEIEGNKLLRHEKNLSND